VDDANDARNKSLAGGVFPQKMSAPAFRRSELVSLDVVDLEFTRAGLIVTLRKSKTDQEGKSRRLGIPYGSGT
jgi:hypothetical protein